MRLAQLENSPHRIPAPERLFVLVVLLVSGTVTLPQVVEFGFMTGLGLWSIAIAGGAWCLWLVKPSTPRGLTGVLAPLAAFSGFCLFSPLWGERNGTVWIQLLTVLIGFTGFVLLTARECGDRPAFRESVGRAMDFASVTAAIAYTLTVLAFGQGGDAELGGRPLFLARPFALFALVAVARQIARWHAGEKSGFFIAAWIAVLVILSQSRLGLVTILAMFPISCFIVGGRRNIALGALMLIVGASTLCGLLMFSQTMYDRFFGFDASLNVGGVSINAMGRTVAWERLLADIHGTSSWLFGHGSGAASWFCSITFVNLPHPHNDYLRFLYDFGLFGLVWFLLFALAALAATWRRVRTAVRENRRADIGPPLGALLGLLALLAAMMTDNPGNYVFVMAPLGILFGAAISRPAVQRAPEPQLDWVFAESEEDDFLHLPGAVGSTPALAGLARSAHGADPGGQPA